MSYADVVQQMQSIQSMLGLLQSSPSVAATKTSSANATTFATALGSATAASDSTAPPSAVSSVAVPGVSTSAIASTDGALVSPNGTTGNDVVDAALDYQGTPYVLGGESKSGIDCSGLVQAAFAKNGVTVPRLVHEQQVLGQKVDSLKDAKPGDLVVLNGGDHIAIWMGNDTVIHAPYPGRNVSVQKAWFTDKDVTTIRRIVPATDDATPTTGIDASSASSASGLLGSSGLSRSTVLDATSMLTTYGADVGLYSASGGSGSDASGGTSLGSLLASFGLSGTSGGTTASSTSAQQIIAARTALPGATS
ncbi:C40 family peptidase [Amnibacterium kyonggiense]|uniref:Cell wall-associated NlpC family hydrolase n=1 Tax=Amnibacterium kyonggiense TaxID=595671 RepID=A0A4R7FQU0_9MICO|nr:C40 family peptidase [Amnibacterium kyonggiense]TDS80076.1 cell wall-associated NlpC family hydrolase [Amnibacterium kyonggiense]